MSAAKRFLLLLSKSWNTLPPTQIGMRHASTSSSSSLKTSNNLATKHFEEITIPVPWGHISGKWYGAKHVRPILCLHGWQDNAGTFDKLIPLLPQNVSYLSLDMPGHGLSSHLPTGIVYHSIDFVVILKRIMDEYHWEKLSIIGHSMSGINGFVFSALFPDKIDMFVGLDILKPLTRSPEHIVDILAERVDKINKFERRAQESEPPCYEWDQLVERLHLGGNKSISAENCKFILQRNCKPSKNEPNKYYFSRDQRLKNSMMYTFSNGISLEMAKRIKCPHLFIKALQAPYFEKKEYYDATLEVLKENPLFECHEVEGTHHVHLNEPERVAPLICSFINRHRTV